MTRTLTILAGISLLLWGSNATAGGDAAAGKAPFEANCGECHYEDDFAGESEEDIMAMLEDLKSGKIEHKGSDETEATSDADLVNIAAFLASFE